jgi:hypothetical protein
MTRMKAKAGMPLMLPLWSALILVPLAQAESNLIENSPFLPIGQVAGTVRENPPLELRSIVKEGGQYEFSLYDPARKQSTWVGLKETGHDFLVKAFDSATEAVTVEQRNRTYTLALKEAAIIPLAPKPLPQTASSNPDEPVVGNGRRVIPIPLVPTPKHPGVLERLQELKRQREDASHGLSPPPKQSPTPVQPR